MHERLGERFGQMLCNRLGDMLDPNMVGERLVKMLGLSPECEKRWICYPVDVLSVGLLSSTCQVY